MPAQEVHRRQQQHQQQHQPQEEQQTPPPPTVPTSLPDLVATIRSEWRAALHGANPGFVFAMAAPFAVLLCLLICGTHAKIAVPLACVAGIVPVWWLKPKVNETARRMQTLRKVE